MPTVESAHWSSDEFRRWIDLLDEDSASGEVNDWLAVRAAPQLRVYDATLAPAVRREWGEVFLLLVGCAERHAAYGPWEAEADRANMRAFVIGELGPAGNDQWHPPAVLRSILATLTLEPDAADALAQRWRELPVAEILLLRRHRNLIGGPLAMVLEHVPDGVDAQLARRWLAVLPRLP
jgi:hypothetical protein